MAQGNETNEIPEAHVRSSWWQRLLAHRKLLMAVAIAMSLGGGCAEGCRGIAHRIVRWHHAHRSEAYEPLWCDDNGVRFFLCDAAKDLEELGVGVGLPDPVPLPIHAVTHGDGLSGASSHSWLAVPMPQVFVISLSVGGDTAVECVHYPWEIEIAGFAIYAPPTLCEPVCDTIAAYGMDPRCGATSSVFGANGRPSATNVVPQQ